MNRVRYIADTLEEALVAARRNHGMGVRVVHAGPRRAGTFARSLSFEVLVEPSSHLTLSRRAARLALARAVCHARMASEEATATLAAASCAGPACQAVLARLQARLRAQALPQSLVEHVLAQVGLEMESAAGDEINQVFRVAAINALAQLLPVASARTPGRADIAGRPYIVAVAGPTGVGKTTTLAKLAAEWRVGRGLRVGLLAADTFRVGAVEQLRTYGTIIDAPVRAADCIDSARTALSHFSSCDVVLVDTTGRSHRDGARIGEVTALLAALRPDETCLVLPGSASARTLEESTDAFAHMKPTRVILSKLDECEGLGALVGAVRRGGVPAGWFTTGQEVPDDIERADSHAFAERLLGSELCSLNGTQEKQRVEAERVEHD